MRALNRAMNVLDVFLESGVPLMLEEVCSYTGLPKTTAYRIIVTLLEGDYLVETEEGYWLGLKMLRFGSLVEHKLNLNQVSRPLLKQLCDQVQETVHLAVLDDEGVLYLEKILPQRAVVAAMMSRVGITSPMHCTGLGKVLAAYLPEDKIRHWVDTHGLKAFTNTTITDTEVFFEHLREIQARGYAIDNGEHEETIRCIAAPVRDRKGEVIAAISIAAPHHRAPVPMIGSPEATLVVQTAQSISASLGYVHEPASEPTQVEPVGSPS